MGLSAAMARSASRVTVATTHPAVQGESVVTTDAAELVEPVATTLLTAQQQRVSMGSATI